MNKKISSIYPNCTKGENHNNYYNIYNMLGEKILFTKEIQPNHFNSNYSRNKSHSDNTIDSNYNLGNELDNKKFELDNFRDLE